MPSDSGIPFYSSFVGGLSDPSTTQYKHRRAVFDLVNKLHIAGLEHQLDLPQIAVVGSQSVGKSSLIESIAGIKLPRAQGTCTRCPIECHLSRSSAPWSCEVYLRLANQEEDIPFGQYMTDSEEVEERIRRAQLAILNPKTRASDFLGTLGSTNTGLTNGLSFSSDLISVRISGVNVDDLSFVDLPGVISSVQPGGRETDIDEVTNLVLKAIEKPSCLILLVISAETDLENQASRRLAKKVDPTGSRTIPVLTKPDRIARGEHGGWLRLLKDEQGHFQHGWYCVKQSDQQQLDRGISWQDARDNEEHFFSQMDPWWREPALQSRLGTHFLTKALGKKLFDLICKRLPNLIREVESRIGSLANEIKRLPIKSTEDPLRVILKLTTAFKRDVEQLVKGHPEAGKTGLVQTFRKSKEQFSAAISRQAPEFKPYDRPVQTPARLKTQAKEWPNTLDEPGMSLSPARTSTPLNFTREEWELSDVEDPSTFVYLDEVLDVAKYAITRELPYNYPYAVKEHYVTRFTKNWPLPAKQLFQNVEFHFSRELDALVVKHFSRFAPGELDGVVLRTVQAQLKICKTRTHQKIKECIALEQEEPATVDEETLALHKAEFCKRYTAARQTHLKKTPNIQNFINGSYDHSTMPQVLQYLLQMGFDNVKKEDLLQLLPVAMGDATAIDIMSEVRAYYQVAYKRFVDYIPMIIDFELLKGFNRSLDDALYQGLGLGEGDTRERCTSFLREDTAVVRLRSTLHHDLERFEAALTALRGISSLSSYATYSTAETPIPEVAEATEELPFSPLRRMSSPEEIAFPEEIAIPPRSPSLFSGEMVLPASSIAAVPPRGEGGNKKKKGKKAAK